MKRTLIVLGIIMGIGVIAATTAAILLTRQSVPSSTQEAGQDVEDAVSHPEIYHQYAALKGEEYDKAFISNMIIHHEGAINMAELALAKAKHQELKDMASAIVASQSKEVVDMKRMQETWGYPSSSGHGMHGGSDDSMQQDMATMGTELQELSDNAFDKRFLEIMINHHQQAIDMALPADANAAHEEVKDMASAIIAAQTREIKEMKEWQSGW